MTRSDPVPSRAPTTLAPACSESGTVPKLLNPPDESGVVFVNVTETAMAAAPAAGSRRYTASVRNAYGVAARASPAPRPVADTATTNATA